ncbi:PepSY-like domain-containing protein [Aurantibacillus circumpalustris]|uniref:PepSY-like domain-containing protein n=1 Tax=Aurantibacillus circumpalustris TaxID=3036359 RepID=UPI00295C04A8|nr:PepSY-like domain-containing protein [Aurantibacillus circumpalustris]
MKKSIVLVLALFVIAFTTKAQDVKEADVPENVKAAFSKKFPKAQAKWEKEGLNYEAEFDMDKVESSVIFDKDGKFIELEQEMQTSDLPKSIIDYCSGRYSTHKIAEASKITLANGSVRFETELRKGREHIDLLFDSTGNFISRGNVEVDNADND